MKRTIALGTILLALFLILGANEEKPRGVFSALQVGQKVSLKEEGQAFTVMTMKNESPLAHEVIEVGVDHLVLRSVSGFETTIPVYSIKAIVKMK